MKPLIVVAVLGLGVGMSAGAAQYTLLIYEHPQELAKRTDTGLSKQSSGSDPVRSLDSCLMIDGESLPGALDRAAQVPATVTGGAAEVRPAYPMSDMNAVR